jgi:hypothetical protein
VTFALPRQTVVLQLVVSVICPWRTPRVEYCEDKLTTIDLNVASGVVVVVVVEGTVVVVVVVAVVDGVVVVVVVVVAGTAVVVVGTAAPTTSLRDDELDGLLSSPLYVADTVWVPMPRVMVEKAACPVPEMATACD